MTVDEKTDTSLVSMQYVSMELETRGVVSSFICTKGNIKITFVVLGGISCCQYLQANNSQAK